MPVQPAARELLRALAPVLSSWGAWYVFGAQAVVAYGVPRLSADVDVTVRLTPDTPAPFVHEMEAAGFSLRASDPDFVHRTRVMPFVHVESGMPLDVVLAESGLEDEFLTRVQLVDLDGVAVPFLHREDLVITKVLAGRPKDIDDAAALWRVHGPRLDAQRIRSILRQLEEALGQSDLLPVFDQLSREATS